MANNNETTTKFKVDISELVKGMQTAKRQISLANAEFKAATAGMDDWGKSADGVSAKLTQLDKTLSNQNKILDNLEEQYRLTAEQMGEDSKEAENLKIKIENQKASIAKTQKQIEQYTKALDGIESESKASESAIDKLSNIIKKQESELADLKKAYSNAVLEYGKNSKEAKALANQLDKLSSELAKNKKEMSSLDKSADDLDRSLDKAADSAEDAKGGFTVLKGALANLVAEGVKLAIDAFKELAGSQEQAANIFRASTGVSVEAMGEYQDAIEDIYKHNFGDSLQDVAEKMAKVKEITGEMDASKLQEMTEAGLTLEDTFGMDMVETLRGVEALVDHFGISAEEAFDLMASGAQQGLNYTDELGDNVSEYSGKFAEAGYTADEYFQLLKNGSSGGAYNLDKVNDAINEVTTRLADGTIEDSLDLFSEETADVFKMWQEGGASQSDVISEIMADIQVATTEQEKMNLAAKAFGTMAEDGGTKFIESLSAVGDSFTDTKGKMDEIKEIRYDDIMNELSGLGRTIKLDLIAPIVQDLLPPVKAGLGWIIDNQEILVGTIAGIGAALLAWNVATMIQGVVASIKAFQLANEGATIAQWALNTAMSANPIGLIIAAIAGLVAAFVVLWNKSEGFRNFWIGLWDGIQLVVGTVVEGIKGLFSGIVSFFQENWQTILLFILNPFAGAFKLLYDKCEGFREFINTLVTSIRDFFIMLGTNIAEIATGIWDTVVGIFTPAIEWFTALFSNIFTTLSDIVSVIITLLQGCWAMICRVFEVAGEWFNTNVIQPVATFFKGLWDKISSGAQAAWDFVSGIFQGVADWFNTNLIEPVTGFFSGMWEKVKSGASDAWAGIKSVFSTVADFFGSIFSDAWQRVKNVFSTGGKIFDGIKDGIVSAFKNIVNAIIRGINKVIEMPFNSINKALDTIRNIEFLGIAPFKGLIDSINVPKIPELYRGGVLKKGQTGFLEGNGDEAVVPLDHNTGWLDEVANRIIAKGNLTPTTNQTVNNTYNYEYNQTNNSPKALSRLDIYRQTKNQIAFAKGV